MQQSQQHYWHPHTGRDIALLTILLSILFGLTLGVFPLHTPDTARYAEIPREMLATGNYLTPYLNGLEYFEKPPLFYWLQAINLKLFGINLFAANLTNALMALFSCLIVYLAGSKLYSRRAGFASALVLATSLLFFSMDHFTTLDMALTTFLAGALFSFVVGATAPAGIGVGADGASSDKKISSLSIICSAIFIALAVMTKGLVGLIFPVAIIFLWLTLARQWGRISFKLVAIGVGVFLLLAAPWHILIQLKHPEFWRFYFIEQHFLRYFTPYAGREQGWWFLPVVLLGGLYPWVFFAVQALIFHGKKHCPAALFLMLWVAVIYLFYTFSNSLLIPYLLPVFPPLALLIGSYFVAHWEEVRSCGCSWGFYACAAANVLIGVGLLLLPPLASITPVTQELWLSSMLFVLALLFIASGITSLLSYRCYGVAKGFVTLVATMLVLLLCVTPLTYGLLSKSVLPIAEVLNKQLKSQDEVVIFANYFQDLPYYLQRHVTVVDYRGELEFGMLHHKGQSWMIDAEELWQRWKNKGRMYMVILTGDYEKLPDQLKKHVYILFKYNDKLLTSNRPQEVNALRK